MTRRTDRRWLYVLTAASALVVTRPAAAQSADARTASPLVVQDSAAPSAAEPPLTVSGSFGDRWIPADSAIVLTLSRVISPAEGRLAIVVGSTDLTPMFERAGGTLRFRARALRLPAGAGDVVLYGVKDGRWTELARLPIRVLTPSGFAAASVKPGFSLGNKGQLAEGHSGSAPSPAPATYQDFGFSGGLQSTHERGAWTVRTQSNYVGVSRRTEALRFGIRQDAAPKVDLADYLFQVQRGPAQLSLGNVTQGANRHLINGFGSRGVELRFGKPVASIALAAMNGSSVVGWDNFAGIGHPGHRIGSGTLNFELLPSRPGALHVDATLLQGSVLPQTSYTQGGVTDAERSMGTGVQLAASTPSQRLRLVAGWSRSRFDNPARDPELLGDTTIVGIRTERRSAMYVEANAALLQNRRIPGLFTTTLNAAYRRERVDPMYRTVAATPQADRLQDAYELSGNLGALAVQLVHGRDHDNLDDLPSVLKTFNRLSTVSLGAPLASLLRVGRGVALYPVLSYGFNRVHQYGASLPTNADFAASHVPDQLTRVHNGSVGWQVGRWRAQYRFNQSHQDNRQTGREQADFLAVVNGLSLDVAARANLDVGIEGSAEHQTARETAETNRVRRGGGTVTWRATPLTTLTAFASRSSTDNDPFTSDTDAWDMRLELARGFDLWRLPDGKGTRGQAFLRWANTTGDLRTFAAEGDLLRDRRRAWTLTSGLTFRLY